MILIGNPVYQATDGHNTVDYINTELRKVFDKHTPMIEKRIKGRPFKWLNQNVKSDINNHDKSLLKARKIRENDQEIYRKLLTGVTTKSKKQKQPFRKPP